MSDEKLEQAVLDRSENSKARGGDREIQPVVEAASPPTLADLSDRIMQSVGRALDEASQRVGEAMKGESTFSNDGDRRVAMALVGRVNQLLPLIEKVAEAEVDEQDRQSIPPLSNVRS